jgi:zinc protease
MLKIDPDPEPAPMTSARLFGESPSLLPLTLLLVCLVGLNPLLAQPAATQPASTKETTLLQQREDRVVAKLPNRMVVIAQRVPTAPVVSTQVWVETGSIYEQQHVGAGLSHYLEHLLSGGTTTNRTEAQSNAILGRIGAQTNAATSLDTVRYYINTSADHATTAISLLSDWMQNSKITEREFQRERQVILREFSMGQGDPGRIFWKLTQQARYQAHPARHPTIGYIERFKDISRQELLDFYHRMYVPNNMVFVVAGDIDPQAMVDQVQKHWADVPASPLPELSFPKEPEIESPRTAEGRADISRPRLRLAWPGTTLGGEHDYALDLLAVVLGQGESSVLKQTIRDEAQLVSSIDAYNASFHWGKGFFGVDAEVARFDVDQSDGDPTQARFKALKQAVLAQVQQIRDEGVSSEALKRAQRMVIASVVKSNQTVQGIASRMARDTIGMADPDYLPKYAERIKSITAGQLQTAAEKLLTQDRLITVRLMPADDANPVTDMSQPDVAAQQERADLPAERVDIDNGQWLDELAKNLDTSQGPERTFEVGQPVQYKLDNGLRLIVQRSTVVPAVSMQMYWLGGLLGDPPGREGLANAMAQMMTRGTESYTADELSQAVESLGADLTADAGNNTTFVKASALKEDWQRVMRLMAEVTLRPTFPASQWEKIKPRILAAIARQDDSWAGELRNHFRNAYFGEHPWSQTPLGRASVVEGLTAEQLAKQHDQQLAAGRSVMTVVGDVEPEAVKAQVQALFDELPTRAEQPFDPPTPAVPDEKLMIESTEKPVAAVEIGFGPGLKRNNPNYAAMQVLANVMSDFPGGWLERQLRGSGDGLAYAVGAGVQTGVVPGFFAILFNSSPEATPEALKKAMQVVRRAKNETISEANLKRARAKTLTGEFLSRQSNGQRAMSLALDELYGVRDPQGEQFIEHVKQVDGKTLNELAQKYLHNPVVVVMSHKTIERQTLEEAIKAPSSEPEQSDESTAAVSDAATQPSE